MNRSEQLERLSNQEEWDIAIIGGGATGLGAALDAASRGYRTVLIERSDFGKGTSSRSTKLIHGGVRYLEQGNIKLVRSALQERWFFLRNAPDLSQRLPFILPVYSYWKLWYFWLGLALYNWLSGRLSIGKTRRLAASEVLEHMPSLNPQGLKGGVLYFDGQFDDTGVCMALAHQAIQHGAVILNYCEASDFLFNGEQISGVHVLDCVSGTDFSIRAKTVVNATGVFAEALMRKAGHTGSSIIKPSRGVHLVADRAYFQGDYALLIPRTTDGRVLFAVPWHNKIVIGTTDTPAEELQAEPQAQQAEIDFILHNFNQYCRTQLTRDKVDAVFAGLRPLVRMKNQSSTANLMRDHTILVSPAGLLTITGGKWTTYRKMAEDVINKAAALAGLLPQPCVTAQIALQRPAMPPHDEASEERLHPAYPFTIAQVLHAIRQEMAMTVEDVLARRIRLLFLDSRAALEAAPAVAALLRKELGRTMEWEQEQLQKFSELAHRYLP